MELARRWTELMAPRSGDIRTELVSEAADFLGISIDDAWDRFRGAGARFRDEWLQTVGDHGNVDVVTNFYNRSDTELFELIEWHAVDPIHYRTLIVRDHAIERSGRRYLDYGSGIGSDAIVFGGSGYAVTLADISDLLLAFAKFRCKRRGLSVRTIDLKRDSLPAARFDLAVCFDVLEHIPDPIRVVRNVRNALDDDGLFVVHAPFGADPEHPMHVVHRDVVTPRMRSLGFQPVDCAFPPTVRAPVLYRKASVPLIDRIGYYAYDGYLSNPAGARLAAWYRRAVRAPRAAASE